MCTGSGVQDVQGLQVHRTHSSVRWTSDTRSRSSLCSKLQEVQCPRLLNSCAHKRWFCSQEGRRNEDARERSPRGRCLVTCMPLWDLQAYPLRSRTSFQTKNEGSSLLRNSSAAAEPMTWRSPGKVFQSLSTHVEGNQCEACEARTNARQIQDEGNTDL